MRALISAPVTAEVVTVLRQRYGWSSAHVPSVADEVATLTTEERKSVAAVVVEGEPVGADLLELLPSLELIACLRADPANVDVAAATAAGIPVLASPGRNAHSVADFTLALLLAMIRGVARSHHDILSGRLLVDDSAQTRTGRDVVWRSPDLDVNPYEVFRGPELSSLVVGVIGFGYMGAAVAARLAGLVQQVVVVDPDADADLVRNEGFELMGLDAALERVDVISLHARSRSVILGRDELARMRPGSYVINTARAGVLDYDAVAAALLSGHLRGAALDVFPEEPLRSSSPLLRLPNVTLTPHLAGASAQVVEHQSATLVATVNALATASTPPDQLPIVNPEVLAHAYPQHEPAAGGAESEEAPR